jgi:hypothetical protein
LTGNKRHAYNKAEIIFFITIFLRFKNCEVFYKLLVFKIATLIIFLQCSDTDRLNEKEEVSVFESIIAGKKTKNFYGG